MRQQLNSGEHFWRGNAALTLIVARQLDPYGRGKPSRYRPGDSLLAFLEAL
jgi:hypothetical protein